MISHIVGGGFGIIACAICVIYSAIYSNAWAVVGSAIYGSSLILLYTMSSVYHGLVHVSAKKVMQILDHCTIYFVIAGTYTPILLCGIRPVAPITSWILFGVVWGLASLATALTAIDLKKYSKFSMVCYILIGWCILFALKTAIEAIELGGLIYLFGGGIAYSIGAVLYGVGKKHRYIHSVFHLFVLLGSVLHFLCILLYIL
jgi:hemolysin III